MTACGEMEWECPMCNSAVTISSRVVDAYGEQHCMRQIEFLRDHHIDEHVAHFSTEMELSGI